MLRIEHISTEGKELDIVRSLFRDYENELDEDLCFQSFEAELAEPLKKYGPPHGDILLAYWNGEVAGCIALTHMKEEGVCEMKRLYVIPAFRKNNIGRMLVKALLSSAREKNYSIMRLDTLDKLVPAIRVYEQFGFSNISPYYENPLPGVVYMQKELDKPDHFM